MQHLEEVLAEVESFLSNPQKLIQGNQDSFNYGHLIESFGHNLPEGFEIGVFTSLKGENIPAFLPFADTNGIAFSIERASDFSFFNELLERSTFKILHAINYNNFKLTLIDGKNHGIYLSNLSQFDDNVTGGKIYKDSSEIAKVLESILSMSVNEFRFIVINNFPQGFTTESLSTLIKVLNSAKKGKLKVLMTKEKDALRTIADLDSSISNKLEVISFDRNNHWYSNTLSQIENINNSFALNFGSSFTDADIKAEIEVINVMHQTTINPASEIFDINEGIKIPFGKYNNKTFYFRLGHGASNYHAIVAGRSGKGKTVFLDNLISRSVTIYSPDELRFALLDMKGIEFNSYENLPHVQAFCSSTDLESGIKIVEFLQKEFKTREALFNNVKARDIVEYKIKSGNVMPRLLVIIDEFQNLFTGNYKTDGFVEDILIKQILRIGRAYGIHIICCTQSLGDGVRSSFLNNIPLRIAFQMTQDQSRSFLSMNNTAAESLKIGEIIYNEQDGLLSENKLVKVDNIQNQDIDNCIMEFINNGKPYQQFEKVQIKK